MAVAAVLAGAASCNSDSSEYYSELDGSAMVKKFALVANDKVLADLDSVFFSIDLVSGDIFNADSLPMGTRIAALAASITTDNASAVTLYVPREGKADSVVNYLEHTADTIDFSNGPVRMEVVSLNGLTKKDYRIRINVHTVKSDSLCWGSQAYAELPAVAAATAQRTITQGSTTYTFSTDGTAYSVAATGDFAAWDPAAFTPGFSMDVNTVTATDNAFYALAADGTLYTASAAAGPWTSTSRKFASLYGAYGTEVMGWSTEVNGVPAVVSYPSMTVVQAPADMPMAGTSPAITLEATMAEQNQIVVTGGRRADGSLSPDTYGFDGTRWMKLSQKGLPEGLEGVAVAPYYSLRNKTVEWRVDVFPTLLAFGGRNAAGEINETVYMSRDWGMYWQKADSLLQPAQSIPAVYGAQTPVAASTMTVARNSAWQEIPSVRLPLGARLEAIASGSRATAPVTEWDVPYVYLFGGYDKDGTLNRAVWRGVINRFTFKPIQ